MNNLRDNIQMFYDFYIVSKEGNMTSAAEKMFTSTSNLSKRISTLEDLLGLKLLNRNNKGISLTSDGEQLFKKLEVAFDILDFNSDVDENAKGTIVIGTTRNIADNVLADYLCKFNDLHPKVEIKILIDSAANLNSYLLEHKIDVLIDYLPQINFTEKEGFEIVSLSQFNTCFACNKAFYEKNKDNIKSLVDLTKFNLVIPGKSRRQQMLDEVLQKNNVILKPIMQMPDSKLMVKIIESKDFIGYFIEDELDGTNLVKLNLKEEMPTNSFGIVYSKKTINKLAKEFVELISK